MGVKEFNKIRDKYGTPIDDEIEFTKVIIDASNLIHTYLSAGYSDLLKQCGKYDFGGIKLDILSQCIQVVANVENAVRNYIHSIMKKHPKADITLVLDPIKTPEYIIDSGNKDVELVYLREIFPDTKLNIGTRSLFHVNMKEKEQKKRQGADKIQEILDAHEDSDEEFKQLVKESMLLGSQHKIILLMEPLLSLLLDEFKNIKKVRFVRAKCEADLLIKNLAYEYKDETVLVRSKDTDYYFLLSDFEWCYCSDLKATAPIYNPNELWNTFLDEKFSYELIVRLSPLIGNDYTAHMNIVNASKDDDIKMFINMDNSFKQLSSKRNNTKLKQIYNIATKNNFIDDINEDELIDCVLLDEMIRLYDFNYFKSYYLSVIIYIEWGFYHEYETLTKISLQIPNYIIKFLNKDSDKMNEEFVSALIPDEDDDEYYEDDVS